MRASTYLTGKSPSFKAASSGFYGAAIDSLQTMMSTKSFSATEEAVLTVALLSACESVMGTSLKSMYVYA